MDIRELLALAGKASTGAGSYAKRRTGSSIGGAVRAPQRGAMGKARSQAIASLIGAKPEGRYGKPPAAGVYGKPAQTSGMLSLGRQAAAQAQNSPQLQQVDGALIKYGRNVDTPWEAQTLLNSSERDQLSRYLNGVAGQQRRPDDAIRRLLQQAMIQQGG